VLVALAILGIGLAVIFQGIGVALGVRRQSEALQRIAIVADRELNRLIIAGAAPEESESGEEDGITWTVERLASPGDGENEGEEATTVVCRITITDQGGRSREIVTLLRTGEEP